MRFLAHRLIIASTSVAMLATMVACSPDAPSPVAPESPVTRATAPNVPVQPPPVLNSAVTLNHCKPTGNKCNYASVVGMVAWSTGTLPTPSALLKTKLILWRSAPPRMVTVPWPWNPADGPDVLIPPLAGRSSKEVRWSSLVRPNNYTIPPSTTHVCLEGEIWIGVTRTAHKFECLELSSGKIFTPK